MLIIESLIFTWFWVWVPTSSQSLFLVILTYGFHILLLIFSLNAMAMTVATFPLYVLSHLSLQPSFVPIKTLFLILSVFLSNSNFPVRRQW